jgi:prophage tail gpP-like protein
VLRAAGRGTSAQIVVAGWRDAGGMIWQPHFIVHVYDPRLYLDREMAIQSVTLTQDIAAGGQGTRASLSLVAPAALNGKGGLTGASSGGGGSGDDFDGSIWDAPEPDPTIGAAG